MQRRFQVERPALYLQSWSSPNAVRLRLFCLLNQGRTSGRHSVPGETRRGDNAVQPGGNHRARGGEQHARASEGDDGRQTKVSAGASLFDIGYICANSMEAAGLE